MTKKLTTQLRIGSLRITATATAGLLMAAGLVSAPLASGEAGAAEPAVAPAAAPSPGLADAPEAPSVQVSKTVGLDPAGETVTVTGSGFLPHAPETTATRIPLLGKFAGAYVTFGSFKPAWKPSENAPKQNRKVLVYKWAIPAEDAGTIEQHGAGPIVLKEDGTFETTLTIAKDDAQALADGRYGVYTYSGGGTKYAPYETFTPISFRSTPAAELTVTPKQPVYNQALPGFSWRVFSAPGAEIDSTGSTISLDGVQLPTAVDRVQARPRARLDAGRHTVTADYPGSESWFPISRSVTFTVAKATPKVTAKLTKTKLRASKRARVAVAVTIPGTLKASAAKFSVRVYDGRKRIAAARLDGAGRASVKLPKLKKGSHRITVTVLATANTAAKTSASMRLRVTR